MKEDEYPQREQNEPFQMVSLQQTFFTITGRLSWFWNEQSELKQSYWVFLRGNWNVRFSADLSWPHSQMWYSPWHFKVLMKSRDNLDSCFIFYGTLMANSAPWPQPSRWPKPSLGPISTHLQPQGRASAGAHHPNLRCHSHFPQLEIGFLSVNIVYSLPLAQGKFYPHCSPKSTPGPSPGPGHCPESLCTGTTPGSSYTFFHAGYCCAP